AKLVVLPPIGDVVNGRVWRYSYAEGPARRRGKVHAERRQRERLVGLRLRAEVADENGVELRKKDGARRQSYAVGSTDDTGEALVLLRPRRPLHVLLLPVAGPVELA